ncbi:MAG TPA: hypothetical protein GX017_01310 [Clostridiales bacterium]|nr:hypothetical protein [Clostridiales bacterium]
MDLFHEESVYKANTGLNTFIYILAWVGMIVFGINAIFWLQSTLMQIVQIGQEGFDILPLLLLAVFGGLTYLCFILRNNQRVEYDYTFTNGTLDIARITNNSRRKKLLSTEVKDFEVIAPISDEGFQRMIQHPGIKKMNYFLNRGSGLYYGVFTHNHEKSILIFEPSEQMVRLFKMVNPRNVKAN